jgi:hypothetical protein
MGRRRRSPSRSLPKPPVPLALRNADPKPGSARAATQIGVPATTKIRATSGRDRACGPQFPSIPEQGRKAPRLTSKCPTATSRAIALPRPNGSSRSDGPAAVQHQDPAGRICHSARRKTQALGGCRAPGIRACTDDSRSVGHGSAMSVLDPIADSSRTSRHVRKVPQPD